MTGIGEQYATTTLGLALQREDAPCGACGQRDEHTDDCAYMREIEQRYVIKEKAA